VDIPTLVRCVDKYKLPIYDPYNEQRLELQRRRAFPGAEGTVYFAVHPRYVLDSGLHELEHALRLDYCVFKLSDLEAFAKKHGRRSFCEQAPEGNRERTEQPDASENVKQEQPKAAEPTTAQAFDHNEDFTSVTSRDGNAFGPLTRTQAAIIRVLYEASKKKPPYLREETILDNAARILEKIDHGKKIKDVFKRDMPAFDALIECVRPGVYRLKT
jgi:hypothetical protein